MNKKIILKFELYKEYARALKTLCESVRPEFLRQFFVENKLKSDYYDCYISLGAILDSIEENSFKVTAGAKENIKTTLFGNELKSLEDFCSCIAMDELEAFFDDADNGDVERCFIALEIIKFYSNKIIL